MALTLRKAQPQDRLQVFAVEKKSTPGLIYLPYVFDQFIADSRGELIVAEDGGELVACGKFSRLPDGSAWLETLRVIPERQGEGIGKRFYQRFFELGRALGAPAMRMYTNVDNHASKGLAERFGFSLAGTYRGQKQPCASIAPSIPPVFEPITDPELAARLLLPFREQWAGFLVMNRTFFAINPALAAHIAGQGMLYHHPASGSVVSLGARFMPQQALHMGVLGGDLDACLDFAASKALQAGVASIHCFYPPTAVEIQAALTARGYPFESSDFIVMEARLD